MHLGVFQAASTPPVVDFDSQYLSKGALAFIGSGTIAFSAMSRLRLTPCLVWFGAVLLVL
jgi:hypothetical protein